MGDLVRLVDTTLRDGVQSLWASRLRPSEAAPLLGELDAVGYEGIELIAPSAAFARTVKTLREDPFDLLRALAAQRRESDFRLHGTVKPIFGHLPQVIRELTLERMASYGLRTTRAASAWNDPVALRADKELVGRFGIRFVADLVYSVSPRHTDEYYVERARAIAAVRPWRICLKDVGGLLTPQRVEALVPRLLSVLDGIELEFHAHSSNGLAPLNVLAAVECGVRVVHVATPPLSSGTSQPSVGVVVRNLEARGYETAVDLEPLERVSEQLERVAALEALPVGVPLEYDEGLYRHQIPGGMISNLQFQLRQLGAEARLEEALEEVAQVRVDFGYPIMITPLSQFVGTQAVLNVLGAKRYELVSDESILYAMGRFGAEAIEVMSPEVRQLLLDKPRAAELQAPPAEEPTLADLRAQYGRSLTDDQLVLRVYVGEEAEAVIGKVPATRADVAPPSAPGSLTGVDLVRLVERLSAGAPARRYTRVDWRDGDASVTVVRRPERGDG